MKLAITERVTSPLRGWAHSRAWPHGLNWNTVTVVCDRALRELWLSVWPYLMIAFSVLLTTTLLDTTLKATANGYVSVVEQPFLSCMVAYFTLTGILMGLLAGTSLTHEREKGTLEVLFFGPIRHSEYILGKMAAYLLGYVTCQAVMVGVYLALSGMTHLVFSQRELAAVLMSVVLAMAIIATGLAAAAIARSTRGAFLLFLGVTTFFVLLEAANVILTGIVTEKSFVWLVYLRDATSVLYSIASWLSPAYYIVAGTGAFFARDSSDVLRILLVDSLYTGASLYLAAWWLRRKGVVQ